MGVSGAGKTTLGRALAGELGWPFLDGDDFHPPQNVAKMAAGVALDDADRWPWLDLLNRELRQRQTAVLACSALKETYRQRLTREVPRFRFIYLHGSFELIAGRLAERRHRYMPAALLRSQFEALEPPAQAIAIDVCGEVRSSVAAIAAQLRA
jgi:gluconokinase